MRADLTGVVAETGGVTSTRALVRPASRVPRGTSERADDLGEKLAHSTDDLAESHHPARGYQENAY
jgi:hypothetical protein